MPNGQSLKYLNEWTELWRLTDTLYDRQLKRWGLSLNAYFVLCLLLDTPEGVEPAVIADKVSILRQSVTVLLNDFEKRKLIVRKESKEDLTGGKRFFSPRADANSRKRSAEKLRKSNLKRLPEFRRNCSMPLWKWHGHFICASKPLRRTEHESARTAVPSAGRSGQSDLSGGIRLSA